MSAEVVGGQRSWSMTRDEEGHRTYKIKHLVRALTTDGPFVVSLAASLPVPGSVWNFDGDLDPWAFCYPTLSATIHQEKEGDPNRFWIVEQTFSTKPLKRCQDTSIEDPLLEPQKISGTFAKYTKEAVFDRNGNAIVTSSWERMKGPEVEFDHNRPAVRVEQNVVALDLATVAPMIDTVNDATLWGLAERTIKLTNFAWERKLYGSCNFYYTRVFDFDIDYNTWDRNLLDEGTKCLNGEWGPVGGIPGSGCTVDVTAAAGIITGVALGAGGTLYPSSSTIQLAVSGGTGGLVSATTNASGVVTGVSLSSGGTAGYTTASGVATSVSVSGWVLKQIGGAAPNKNNPQHFTRFKDRKGENCRVVLDGNGLPASTNIFSNRQLNTSGDPGMVFVEYYGESNFLTLGIPTSL